MFKYKKYKEKSTTEAIRSYWLAVGNLINEQIKIESDRQNKKNECN
jgi:hypothetical protein